MALLSKIQDFLSNMYLGRNKERKKIKTFGNLCTCAENDQLNILDCKKKKTLVCQYITVLYTNIHERLPLFLPDL